MLAHCSLAQYNVQQNTQKNNKMSTFVADFGWAHAHCPILIILSFNYFFLLVVVVRMPQIKRTAAYFAMSTD